MKLEKLWVNKMNGFKIEFKGETNGIHAAYNITNIVAYYILPRYIQEN